MFWSTRRLFEPEAVSWLNMAEIELSILSRQCLSQRFASADEMDAAIRTWETTRNATRAGTNWQFTTPNARIKLKTLYPLPDIQR
ncbi:MAG: hypothetical protein R3C02_14525 [Planctomycetaceae bacterium]